MVCEKVPYPFCFEHVASLAKGQRGRNVQMDDDAEDFMDKWLDAASVPLSRRDRENVLDLTRYHRRSSTVSQPARL
jgi:hypothetical protein